MEQVQEPLKSYMFGYDVDLYKMRLDTFEKYDVLSSILTKYGVDYSKTIELAEASKGVFNVSSLRAGKPFHIVMDSCDHVESMVYIPNVYRYVKFNLKDSVYVEEIAHPIDRKWATGKGIIESSLWMSMINSDLDPNLIVRLEDALAWSVDFHHAQKGDQYAMLYEQEYIEGKEVGVGALVGAFYQNKYNNYFSIWYEDTLGNQSGYYDQLGRPSKRTFLRAPVKFSRISSAFSRNRFHPVLKRNKPHLGTDYAAPRGTPIIAVANGVVTKVAYTRGNGRYVKIKHDKTYQTQYLHMERFAKDISPGVQVKQGQVIGYVGSSGLATGPHVCFRFWKNGKQVNHRKLYFPPAKPLPPSKLQEFYQHRDTILPKILENFPAKDSLIRAVTKPENEIPA